MLSRLLRNREEDSQSPAKKAKKTKAEKESKPKDDLRHSGLPSQAKHVLREAYKQIGTPEAPRRGHALRSSMKEIRAGRYGQEPHTGVIRSRASAMLADSTTESLWTAYEASEWGGLNDASSEWAVRTAYRLLGPRQ